MKTTAAMLTHASKLAERTYGARRSSASPPAPPPSPPSPPPSPPISSRIRPHATGSHVFVVSAGLVSSGFTKEMLSASVACTARLLSALSVVVQMNSLVRVSHDAMLFFTSHPHQAAHRHTHDSRFLGGCMHSARDV